MARVAYGDEDGSPAIKALAGFDPDRASYYLPRSALEPVEDLQLKVFPELEEWRRKLDAGELEDESICLDAFMTTLKYLRVVLLQDAVLMKSRFPDLFLWQHELFSDPLFLSFERQLKESIASAQDPHDLQIQVLLPGVLETMNENHRSIQSEAAGRHLAAMEILNEQKLEQQRLSNAVFDILSGKAPIRIQADLSNSGISSAPASNKTETVPAINLQEILSNSGISSAPANNVTETRSVSAVSQGSSSREIGVVQYSMSRNIVTVRDVYREWSTGLGTGPAVKSLEETYGTKWRKADKDMRHFNRRKLIIDEVELEASQRNLPVDTIIREMDQDIKIRKRSLAQLQNEISTKRRAQ